MSSKIFDVVQMEQPNRNSFDLTHDYKTTLDMGRLVPVCCMECIPGDRFTLGSQALVRFAPMIAPTMQRYDARIEYFWVANRLLWENWNKFISSDPGNLAAIPAFPTIDIADGGSYTKLMDYLGIPNPTGTGQHEVVSALPFAAYQLIYDTYYRDQNLIPPNTLGTKLMDGDNSDNMAYLTDIRNRAWEHDYFTSCLPFAQKGNPVTIGAATFPDVEVKMNQTPGTFGNSILYQGSVDGGPVGPTTLQNVEGTADVSANLMYADTSELAAFSLTINDLREAEALQKWLEINMRAGTRPNEVIEGHFNVKSSDARLQRPEYIVGIKQTVSVSEVLNTSGLTSDDGGGPVGDMAGHGVGMIDDENYGSFFCEEHGFIIGIMSVMPRTSYQQGLSKFWLKTKDATQYFWPSFAHIGEQPVLRKEIYAFQGAPGEQPFGYLPAYQDYRFVNSMVTGDFRSTLSYWTAGRIFDTPPTLNAQFITSDPRKDIFAVESPDVDSLYVHVLNKVFASRLIPVYGTPSLG